MSDTPQISRRSFLRASSSVTAATILIGLPSVSTHATPPTTPPPPSAIPATPTVVIPATFNMTSFAISYSYTITWTYPDGSTDVIPVNFTLQPGGSRPEDKRTNGAASSGSVSGGESTLPPPVK